MCLSKAYVDCDGDKELLMADVASLEITRGKLLLKTLFGEQQEIGANIKQVDFLNHSITLEKPK
jgi:predicted RNA-binding protein